MPSGRRYGTAPIRRTWASRSESLWASQMDTQRVILAALGPDPSFQTRVIVAACLAAASTAVLTWVENNGTPELPDLINEAFETLTAYPTARNEL